MINDQYKFISVDIPRTACSARARLFAGVPDHVFMGPDMQAWMNAVFWSDIPKHARALQYRQCASEKFESYYKYSFVRNPWDRMVSYFRYRQRKIGANDFENYITKDEFRDLRVQQLDYLCDLKGNILVDIIGRFENLYQDFEMVCKAIGFSGKLSNQEEKIKQDYTVFYNDKTRKIVTQRFKKDIEFFGYKFGE